MEQFAESKGISMKLRTIIAALAASVAVAAPAAAEEQVYYCSSELATGFTKDKQTGQWRTSPFVNIRFTMKFGERTKGSAEIYNRDLVLSKDGEQDHFICSFITDGPYNCVQVMALDTALFFALDPGPDQMTGFRTNHLITDLKRFELYRGSEFGFVGDGHWLINSSMHAGTCETN